MSKVGWFDYAKASEAKYVGSDWGVSAFLQKHSSKWISYKDKQDLSSPALYLVRSWQEKALQDAKILASGSTNYYEALANIGHKIATSDDYPVCQEYLDIWEELYNQK